MRVLLACFNSHSVNFKLILNSCHAWFKYRGKQKTTRASGIAAHSTLVESLSFSERLQEKSVLRAHQCTRTRSSRTTESLGRNPPPLFAAGRLFYFFSDPVAHWIFTALFHLCVSMQQRLRSLTAHSLRRSVDSNNSPDQRWVLCFSRRTHLAPLAALHLLFYIYADNPPPPIKTFLCAATKILSVVLLAFAARGRFSSFAH